MRLISAVDDPMSKCARNARALAATARGRDGVTVELELFRRSAAGGFEAVK
jgi:hypothetical protein